MTFTNIFYKHIILRHSCGKCHFTNLQRPSDITLADLWGWEKACPGINDDDKGVSLVLINTVKGQEVWNTIQDDLIIVPVDINDCMQTNLMNPTSIHPDRMEFERIYKEKGFITAMRRWGDYGWQYICKKKLSQIKRTVRSLLK